MIIRAYGNPAPQGSKRNFGKTKLGKTIMVEASDKVTPWRSDVMTACRQHIDALNKFGERFVRFEGPVIARMVFTLDRPKSVSRARRPAPCIAPDLSKLLRSTEDALQAAGVVKDDALIVEYTRAAKVYVGEDEEALTSPGCLIVLGAYVPLVEVEGTPPPGRMGKTA